VLFYLLCFDTVLDSGGWLVDRPKAETMFDFETDPNKSKFYDFLRVVFII